jgi:hypothetical protein
VGLSTEMYIGIGQTSAAAGSGSSVPIAANPVNTQLLLLWAGVAGAMAIVLPGALKLAAAVPAYLAYAVGYKGGSVLGLSGWGDGYCFKLDGPGCAMASRRAR